MPKVFHIARIEQGGLQASSYDLAQTPESKKGRAIAQQAKLIGEA